MSMKKHHDFNRWAVAQGVEINGIAAHKFPGRGVGIVARKRHEAGEVLLNVPADALRTVDTIPRHIFQATGDGPVHGKLALSECLDTTSSRALWQAVMPSKDDFREYMPFMWHTALQDLLPPAAKMLLENQQRKYNYDWAISSEAFPDLNEDKYVYNWLLVNTRTFYWVTPGTKRTPVRDDCLALAPYADYFNHADIGCKVNFGVTGVTITSDRVYEKAEEIYISYGPHSNDFLLAEYGFVLLENRWDEIRLDQVLLPELSTVQQNILKKEGFLGNYILDRETVCYRTQVAVRILCMSLKKWRVFILGEDDDGRDQQRVDQILLRLLRRYFEHAKEVIDKIEATSVGLEIQRDTLVRRWKQIRDLLLISTNRIQGP